MFFCVGRQGLDFHIYMSREVGHHAVNVANKEGEGVLAHKEQYIRGFVRVWYSFISSYQK